MICQTGEMYGYFKQFGFINNVSHLLQAQGHEITLLIIWMFGCHIGPQSQFWYTFMCLSALRNTNTLKMLATFRDEGSRILIDKSFVSCMILHKNWPRING